MNQGKNWIRPLWLACLLGVAACDRSPKPPAAPVPPAVTTELRDEIPPARLASVIDAHYRGLGAMERYEYRAAVDAFRVVQEAAPGWTPGMINLSIALLNLGGEAAEKAKQEGQEGGDQASVQNIDRAKQLLDQVLMRQPDQPYALFSRGIILQSQGDYQAAHRDFARVTEIDPHDANAWNSFGETLMDSDREGMPAGRDQAPQLIAAFTKALEANPYLVTAMFRLQTAYKLAGDRDRSAKMLALFLKLNPKRNAAGSGETAALVYGEMGRYAQVLDPFRRPSQPEASLIPPRFGAADLVAVTLPAGDRWATAADLVGRYAPIGRAQKRFGAGVACFDVNRDGLLDLYMTASVVGPAGLRDVLLVNQGNGKFLDATAAYGLPLDRAGLGIAASDFDADFHVDLYLTGINDNRLFRQEKNRFIDVTQAAGVVIDGAISLTARWLDIDQDGDLDLFVVNHADSSDLESAFVAGPAGVGRLNSVFRNDGKPALVGQRPEDNAAPLAMATADLPATQGLSLAFSASWPSAAVLAGESSRHTALAALDIDDDRDVDLVMTADGQPPAVMLNDRGGIFHLTTLGNWPTEATVSNLLVTDADKDGHPDLVATTPSGPTFAWRNATTRVGSNVVVRGESYPLNARNWLSATTVDLDLDTWHDLVGISAASTAAGLEWARNTGTRFEKQSLALGPVGNESRSLAGFTTANLVGDPLPDLILRRDGEAPRLAPNLGNGRHWLAIDISGRWKTSHDQMRTNSEGLGARLSLEGRGLFVPFDYTTPEAGTGQSVGPFVLGMGSLLNAPLLRTRWPDGVMQSELNVTADKTLKLVELNRKTGSCPILFTWNGDRFVCQGDFAGAAGLGFLEVPGEYHPPDRDESLAITPDQLRVVGQKLRMSIVEPMDEIAYLDHLALEVVDHPVTTHVALDERFAFGGSPPTGQLITWSQSRPPIAARDECDRDVLALISATDRRTVDQFPRLNGWIGYTAEHALMLDFGKPLTAAESAYEPTLCLTGWVEYPYSQTNYAAAGSGAVLRPPVLEQQLSSGEWQVIDPALGHPAGLPRMMTLSLKGKLVTGAPLIFRIRTNMECYWDQAFLALVDPDLQRSTRSRVLPVARAELRDRGYLREFSPDGQAPALPDYHHVDPVPLARVQGQLTRHGAVASLLQTDDDLLCVMGPGDEVLLDFDASLLPPIAAGWVRSYVFRSVAYCKDLDPFTATSDTVGPLPWKGMKSFPLPPGGERPLDPAYAEYLQNFQTRPAGER